MCAERTRVRRGLGPLENNALRIARTPKAASQCWFESSHPDHCRRAPIRGPFGSFVPAGAGPSVRLPLNTTHSRRIAAGRAGGSRVLPARSSGWTLDPTRPQGRQSDTFTGWAKRPGLPASWKSTSTSLSETAMSGSVSSFRSATTTDATSLLSTGSPSGIR